MVALVGEAFARAGRPTLANAMADIPSYHTTPEQAAEVAQAAGVKALVFTHVVPMVPKILEAEFLGKSADIYGGRLHLGHDGDWISLPAGGAAIEIGHRP
jgi:ribonuclease Z